MLDAIESAAASFVRRYFPGYEYIALIYKMLVYFLLSKRTPDVNTVEGYEIVDVDKRLEGMTFFGYYDRIIENSKGEFIFVCKRNSRAYLTVQSSKSEIIFEQEIFIWNYQQGVLATWLNDDEIIFNVLHKGKVVACRHNVVNHKVVFLQYPFQSSSLCGRRICSIDLGILKKIRPEYSYEMCSNDAFNNNQNKLIILDQNGNVDIEINYSLIKELAFKDLKIQNFKVNHCIFSPSGRLLIFLARGWERKKKLHVLMCLDCETKILKPIIKGEIVSHFNWLDYRKFVYWGTKDKLKSYHIVRMENIENFSIHSLHGDLSSDGHPSPISENEFITDTYPNRSRLSELKKISINEDYTTNIEILASLRQPFKFFGKNRVDLHPRQNYKGEIYIDSAHTGTRRLMRVSKIC